MVTEVEGGLSGVSMVGVCLLLLGGYGWRGEEDSLPIPRLPRVLVEPGPLAPTAMPPVMREAGRFPPSL